MSDSEDVDVILEDIEALQAALAQNKKYEIKEEVKSEFLISEKHNLCEPSTSKTTNDIDLLTSHTIIYDSTARDTFLEVEENESEEEEEEDEEEESNFDVLSDPDAALILNQKLINLLSTAKKRLQLLLKECKDRQLAIDQKITQRTSESQSRILLTVAGIPYFKDKQHFPAPQNQDAKIKAKRGELQIIDLPCPSRWTLKDRNMLWEAIYRNAKAINTRLQAKSTESQEDAISSSDTEDPLQIYYKAQGRKRVIQNIKRLVGPLGSQEFDWLKISVTDFNGRHSSSECRAMWNVFLHPDINKGKWKKNEDNALKLYAEEYNFQNWDEIAVKLGTNRSGYQCFIRFNTNFKNNMFSRISSWSKEEDQKLTDAINALRTGNFIPWGEVAKAMGNRRKQQIYMRWNYSLAPNLKKGRFTEEEDKLLLQGLAKFGSNFTKISVALLPHRNTAQLNDRYRTLMNEKENNWSCEDDMKLSNLYDKLGNNWSAIAKKFSNKSRVQVRHRHTAIMRYLGRGFSINTIPRWGQAKEESKTPEQIMTQGEQLLNEMSELIRIREEEKRREGISKIDSELRDYFKPIYRSYSKPGRNKKFYTSEELDETTRKLYIILNMLSADLNIPDDLEDYLFLTEKDKQLLNSLKIYSRNRSLESEAKQKYIEYIRRKMFGSSIPSTDDERFIPPLPFNGSVQRCRKRKLIGMNYIPNGDRYIVNVTEELNTPEIIISLIGGWENEIEFQNLEKIFIGKTRGSLENLSSITTLDFHEPSTSSGIINSDNHPSVQTIGKNVSKYYPEMLIPPNYVTLLGFRGVLLSKHILEAENSEDEEHEDDKECIISSTGKKALQLFEDRLVKLFKFPIELSEIPPPVLHGLPNGEFDDIGNNNCNKKRKLNQIGLNSITDRKKTELEKVDIRDTSETQ